MFKPFFNQLVTSTCIHSFTVAFSLRFIDFFTIIQAFLIFWVVYYVSNFQSDMLYLLILWYFWFLFISTTIELYCRYTLKLQILGHSTQRVIFSCVVLQLLLFEGHTTD